MLPGDAAGGDSAHWLAARSSTVGAQAGLLICRDKGPGVVLREPSELLAALHRLVEDDIELFVLTVVGLKGFEDFYAWQVSGGMQQRVAVARTLDRLAAEGLRFTRAYSNSPVCSPARFALMTGRWHYRLRGAAEEPLGRRSDVLGLPTERATLPSLLRGASYATALIASRP